MEARVGVLGGSDIGPSAKRQARHGHCTKAPYPKRHRWFWLRVAIVAMAMGALAAALALNWTESLSGPSVSHSCIATWISSHASPAVRRDLADKRPFAPHVQGSLQQATEACYGAPRVPGVVGPWAAT